MTTHIEVQSMCPACSKLYWYPITHSLPHGLVETVTLTCLSTNNCYHLPRVSLSNNLPWVSPSHNLPCVSLFPDMPRASLYITLTNRDNQFLTMFRASLSRHRPTNSWLHTDNLSTFLQLNYNREVALFSHHYGQHMVNLSTGTISNLLHMDNQLHYLPRARLYNALLN